MIPNLSDHIPGALKTKEFWIGAGIGAGCISLIVAGIALAILGVQNIHFTSIQNLGWRGTSFILLDPSKGFLMLMGAGILLGGGELHC